MIDNVSMNSNEISDWEFRFDKNNFGVQFDTWHHIFVDT